MLKIGHRGRPGNPRKGENTIHSFEDALAAGAEALELDVRKTRDNKLVVIHDLAIDRTTNGHGNVSDLSYEDLSEFDAGFGEPVPLFSAVLDKFGGKCLLNIELKESGIEEMVRSEISTRKLHELPYSRSILISAFDKDDNDPGADSSWEQLKIFLPSFPTALLAQASKVKRMGEEGFVKTAKQFEVKAIHPEEDGTTATLVALAHKAGLLVNVWTVNEPAQVTKFKEMGVDGLISDFAERL